mmetsp:Transcript_38867/g.97205  ORF Transcript_38867/g.97205 Transcript_38867/m.97205 type:complete len:81 (+) Transcript_38867:1145-1387(+)
MSSWSRQNRIRVCLPVIELDRLTQEQRRRACTCLKEVSSREEGLVERGRCLRQLEDIFQEEWLPDVRNLRERKRTSQGSL